MNESPILLVEDDVNDVFFFQHAMKKASVTNAVQVVLDGQDAINYLSGEGEFIDREKYPLPCVIVLDLNMPRKNGFEVLEWMQKTPPMNLLPAIILSSSQADKDQQKARELGARAYYVKPSNPAKLAELVKLMTPIFLEPQPSG
jgi:CheY-like chemotaxis protein